MYPWATFPESETVTICDVGGSTGHVVLNVLQAFPSRNFKAVIQDKRGALEEGRSVCSSIWFAMYFSANTFLLTVMGGRVS